MAYRHEARIGPDRLTVKHGLRKLDAPLSEIAHLFIQSTDRQQTLLISMRPSFGKARVVRLRANPGDPGFLALVEALAALRSGIDLRGMDEKVALARMGAVTGKPVGVALLILLLPTLVALALLPKLIHGLDFGEDRVSVTSLAKGRQPSSRNVVITGARAKLHESIEVTTSRNQGADTSGTTRYLVPIVSPDWEKDQPVHVILETDEMNSADEARLERASKFRGIMRDILWEGLGRGDRDYFLSEVGLNLAADVKLVEYRANPRYDLLVFCSATGVTFAVTLALAIGIWLRKRRD
jgi:uncharacterized protein (TIGR03382 family)